MQQELIDAYNLAPRVALNEPRVVLLAQAYKWHRQNPPRVTGRYGLEPLRETNAIEALRLAREDATNGKRRYPSNSRGNIGAPSEDGLRWFENPERHFRFVGLAQDLIPRSRHSHNGWYMERDNFDEVARGVVYAMPAKNGMSRLLAGIADPYNSNASGNGPALISFASLFETEPNGTSFDAIDAAREADSLAEHYAEQAREYNEAFSDGSRFAQLIEDATTLRSEIIELCSEARALRQSTPHPLPVAIRKTICEKVRRRLRDLYEAREARDELGDAWRYSKRLREAFEDGAGIR